MKRFVFFLVALSAITGTRAQWAGKEKVKINGRIQYDFEFLKRQEANEWMMGNEFRRVHLSAAGKLEGGFDYKIEVNFAQGQIGFRDVFIRYSSEKWGKIAVGSMAEPTGLAMATSSKYISFLERPMLTALEDFRWGTGLHYDYDELFEGHGGIQLSVTNKGKNTEGFIDRDLNEGLGAAGRFYVVPYHNAKKHNLLHLGINAASRPPEELSFRPENHMGDKYVYEFPGAERRLETGWETALVFNNIYFQGEYKRLNIPNTLDKNYIVSGYYAQVGAFLTGEYKPYKDGAFGRVKPKRPWGKGAGALEVLFRYSVMDFSDDIMEDNPGEPPSVINTAFGLNWYLTSHVRIMYNYIITDDMISPEGKLNAHLVRIQMDF